MAIRFPYVFMATGRLFPAALLFMLVSFSTASSAQEWRVAVFRTDAPYAGEQEDALKKKLDRLAAAENTAVDYVAVRIVSSNLENFSDTAMEVGGVLAEKPDVIATIGTQATAPAWAVEEKTEIPLVFAGVSFPREMELIGDFGKPTGKNITGIGYFIPVKLRLTLMRKIFPDTARYRKLAFIYTGSVVQDYIYRKKLADLGNHAGWNISFIDFFDYTQQEPNLELLLDRLGKVDPDLAFGWFGLNQLGGDSERFQKLLKTFRKPIVVGSNELIRKGAVAGTLTDHVELGSTQAEMIHRIIKGEKASDIPPVEPSRCLIQLNIKNAKQMGINFPEEVVRSADFIVR